MSDITTPAKQIVSTNPSKLTVTSVPLPEGIDPPENEKPRTVEALVDSVNPASVADPPDAPVIETPSKPNWKPPTASSFSI